jgi:hypothetical protein
LVAREIRNMIELLFGKNIAYQGDKKYTGKVYLAEENNAKLS